MNENNLVKYANCELLSNNYANVVKEAEFKINSTDLEIINFEKEFDDFDELDKVEKELSEMESLRIEIDEGFEEGFEEALKEIEEIEEELKKFQPENFVELCKKNVMDTISQQLGIELTMVNTRNVYDYKFDKDTKDKQIISSISKEEHRRFNYSDREYKNSTNSQGKTFGTVSEEFKDGLSDSNNMIKDAYQKGNKKIAKDLTDSDHINTLENFHYNYDGYAKSKKGKANFATDTENLAPTHQSINRSMKSKEKMEYYERKGGKHTDKKGNVYNLSEEKLQSAQQRGQETGEKHKATVGEIAKFYATDAVKTAGLEAGKRLLYSAFGGILKDFAQALFEEIHITWIEREQGKTWKEIFDRFKIRLKKVVENIKETWKDRLKGCIEEAIKAFFSNIVELVVRLVTKSVTKLFRNMIVMIKTGFNSIWNAIRILSNPEKYGISKEDAKFEAAKVLVTGITTGLFIGLQTVVQKYLMVIGLDFVISPLSNILFGIVGGLVSTIVIYQMDKYRNDNKKRNLQIQLVHQGGIVVQYGLAQSWFALGDAYREAKVINHSLIDVYNSSINNFNSLIETNMMVEDVKHYSKKIITAGTEMLNNTQNHLQYENRKTNLLIEQNTIDNNEVKKLLNELSN